MVLVNALAFWNENLFNVIFSTQDIPQSIRDKAVRTQSKMYYQSSVAALDRQIMYAMSCRTEFRDQLEQWGLPTFESLDKII
jgi:hypothetical protein